MNLQFSHSHFHTITLVNKLGVQCTPGPIHVGPFGKCSLWDDYTLGHSAAAPLVAGVLGVQYTPGPIHVGPFGKCSLWDDYTLGHSAAALLVAGRLWALLY